MPHYDSRRLRERAFAAFVHKHEFSLSMTQPQPWLSCPQHHGRTRPPHVVTAAARGTCHTRAATAQGLLQSDSSATDTEETT